MEPTRQTDGSALRTTCKEPCPWTVCPDGEGRLAHGALLPLPEVSHPELVHCGCRVGTQGVLLGQVEEAPNRVLPKRTGQQCHMPVIFRWRAPCPGERFAGRGGEPPLGPWGCCSFSTGHPRGGGTAGSPTCPVGQVGRRKGGKRGDAE